MEQSSLTKRPKSKLNWQMEVRQEEHIFGIFQPVFCWRRGRRQRLIAWPVQGIITFKNGKGLMRFEDIEGILSEVKRCGLSKPPHLKQVFQAARDCSKKFPMEVKEAKQVYQRLQEEWQAIANH